MDLLPEDLKEIEDYYSGIGAREKAMMTGLQDLNRDEVEAFRSSTPRLIKSGGLCYYERLGNRHIESMRSSFLYLNRAITMWTQHPCQRDAALVRSAFQNDGEPKHVLVEVLCTRGKLELQNMQAAYEAMYGCIVHKQLEAAAISFVEREALIILLLEDRYLSTHPEEIVKKDAAALFKVLTGEGDKFDTERVLELIGYKSIAHLKSVREHYKSMCGMSIHEHLETLGKYELLGVIFNCLLDTPSYFCEVIEAALEAEEDDHYARDGLMRVIVTRADKDMKAIENAFSEKHNGKDFLFTIVSATGGEYKNFLVNLISRSAVDTN